MADNTPKCLVEGWDELVDRVEQMGVNIKDIIDEAFAEETPHMKATMRSRTPRAADTTKDGKPYVNPQGHARDNVIVKSPRTSKFGTRYIVTTFSGDRSYLYIIDKGSSKQPAHPWIDLARENFETYVTPKVREKIADKMQKIIDGE